MNPTPLQPCRYCGESVFHTGICPRIKAIEYHPDGSIKRVEFLENLPAGIHVTPLPPPPWDVTSSTRPIAEDET